MKINKQNYTILSTSDVENTFIFGCFKLGTILLLKFWISGAINPTISCHQRKLLPLQVGERAEIEDITSVVLIENGHHSNSIWFEIDLLCQIPICEGILK